MKAIAVDPSGIEIMAAKGDFLILKTDPLSFPAANILKQQMLSIGGECAVSREVATGKAPDTSVILMGNGRQYQRLINNLKQQYFGLADLGTEIEEFFNRQTGRRSFLIGKKSYPCDGKTLVMGILNLTPDSFFDGGKHTDTEKAFEAAVQMENDGADLIDIGAESTRPGANPITTVEEIERLQPLLERLLPHLKIPISIDTYKSAVAEWALNAGAAAINDISGLNFDPAMAGTIARHSATVMVMHIKGTPKNMQVNPHYDNLIDEILDYLEQSVRRARQAGIEESNIIIDPGIGFGKTPDDNYRIIQFLREFRSIGFPVLVGPSRKSFIGHVLGLPPEERLEGTLATITAAVLNGAAIVRVHDVKAIVRTVKIADAILGRK